MSEIINTGLGWWANEDWLKSNIGQIASVESGTITWPQEPKIPNAAANAATFTGSLYVGNIYSNQRAVFTYDNDAVFVAMYKTGTDTYNVYMASRSRFTWNGIIKSSGGTYSIYNTVHQTATLNSLGFYEASGFGGAYTLSTIPANITRYTSIENARNAFDSFHPIQYNVSKLNSGYAIACGIKYINRNMETVTAPVLVSTVSDYTKFSLDGSTETPGLLTGIEFGGMTFYVNILLLGVSEGYTFSCEYADITSTYPGGANVTDIFRAIVTLAQVRFSDPYREGGISGPGGGGGTFDFTSTDIPIPTLPTIGAYDTGFISLYKPSDSELRALAAYLWSGPFDLDNFKKIFANPMDCILGLHIIPTAGAHPLASASALKVGNISTGLSMQRLSEQYYELDCGSITIDPKWGAYLDYSPYSKLSLFLPYIGFVTISPDDCMNGSIRVVYHVDVLSGSCCAYVYCASNQGADGHTLYTFTGGCACDCPVTEGQYTNGLFGSLRGGMGLAAGLLSGSPAGIMGGIEEAANAALSMVKPDVGRSGSFGGSAGLMGIQYPYLVLTIPKMCIPGDQNIYRGYPSFVTEELGNISGYASVEITHMENMSATDDEVSEIMGLLGEGVIF